MKTTGFLETLSPLVQPSTKALATRIVINQHVYLFKENDDLWDDRELDRLVAARVISRNTVLRGKGHFICEVTDPEDYASILSIGAGYRPYAPVNEAPKREAVKSAIPNTRKASASATKAPRKASQAAKPNTPRPGAVQALAIDPAAG